MQFIPFILRSPLVKKFMMSDVFVIPCPNTVYLYLPMGVVIHSKSWDSTSTLTWWYPEVISKDTKYLLSGLICRNGWDELSFRYVRRSKFLEVSQPQSRLHHRFPLEPGTPSMTILMVLYHILLELLHLSSSSLPSCTFSVGGTTEFQVVDSK